MKQVLLQLCIFLLYIHYLFMYFFYTYGLRYSLGYKLESIVDFMAVINNNGPLTGLLCLHCLALAGIPPLSGFCGKFVIIRSLLNKDILF